MRLALLGPADGHADALEAAMRFVLEDCASDRAVYLGMDDELDRLVAEWAQALVGNNPGADGTWARAARACLHATPAEIDAHIERERARTRLRLFESLLDTETRAVEMLGGTLAVMIYDKASLSEEDMLPARLLLFGKSQVPVVKQVGPRWFLSPGSFDSAGVMTLDDDDDGIVLTLFDRSLKPSRTERLSTHRATKLKVEGAGA